MSKGIGRGMFRAIAFVLAFCILSVTMFSYIGNSTVVEAKTIAEMEKEIKELEKKEKELAASITNATKKIKDEKAKQDLLQNQIKSVEEQISIYQQKIIAVTDAIGVKEAEITQKLADIEVNEELFAKRVRAMYMSSASSSTLTTLLESKSFSQFLNTAEFLTRISKSDQDLIKELTQQKKDLLTKKTELEDNQADLKKTKSEFDAKNKSLDTMYDNSLGAEAEAKKNEKALWLLMEKNKTASQKVEKELDAAIAAAKNNGSGPQGPLLWPLPVKSYFSSYFGWRTLWGKKDYHTGIDLPASAGTSIFAAADGEVILATKANSSYGWHVVINHNGGLVTLYGHMSRIDVSVGQQVKRGQTIGGVGTTGNSSGNHLHFEVRQDEVRQNPLNYVKQPT